MTDMQRFAYHPGEGVMRRYTVDPDDLLEHVPVSMYPNLREVFLASDAEAAITAAAEHAVAEHIALADKVFAEMLRQAEAKGQRDMLTKAIAAIDEPEVWVGGRKAALEALRALGGSDE